MKVRPKCELLLSVMENKEYDVIDNKDMFQNKMIKISGKSPWFNLRDFEIIKQ